MRNKRSVIRNGQAYARAGILRDPATPGMDIWPGYESVFVRRPQEADAGDQAVPDRKAVRGIFGLVPHWVKPGHDEKTNPCKRLEQ